MCSVVRVLRFTSPNLASEKWRPRNLLGAMYKKICTRKPLEVSCVHSFLDFYDGGTYLAKWWNSSEDVKLGNLCGRMSWKISGKLAENQAAIRIVIRGAYSRCRVLFRWDGKCIGQEVRGLQSKNGLHTLWDWTQQKHRFLMGYFRCFGGSCSNITYFVLWTICCISRTRVPCCIPDVGLLASYISGIDFETWERLTC